MSVSLAGAISVVVGICLIVPCSIGIGEYNDADSRTKNRIEAERVLQILILVLALVLLVVGIGLISRSSTAQVLADNLHDFTTVNTELAKTKFKEAKVMMDMAKKQHRTRQTKGT